MAIKFLTIIAPLMLCGCMQPDVGPNPALANVEIITIYAQPKQIAANGQMWNVLANGTVAAYSYFLGPKTCVIVLPITYDRAYQERLRIHETRHCHGEQHPGKGRFDDEAPF